MVISPATGQKTTQESSATQEPGKSDCGAQKTGVRILELVRENPKIKTVEMARMLGLTRDGVNYHLRAMKAKGLLAHARGRRNGLQRPKKKLILRGAQLRCGESAESGPLVLRRRRIMKG